MYSINSMYSGILHKVVIDIDKFISDVNPNKIYLDVDGVIWHSCQAVCDTYYDICGAPRKIKGQDVLSWNFKELDNNLTDFDIEYLFAHERFFEIVKQIKGAYNFIRRYEDKIIIVTKGTKDNIYHKIDILNEHFSIPIISLPFECSKGSIDMTGGLHIDDCTNNLKESNATYKIQFLEYNDEYNDIRNWTKGWNGLKMYRW